MCVCVCTFKNRVDPNTGVKKEGGLPGLKGVGGVQTEGGSAVLLLYNRYQCSAVVQQVPVCMERGTSEHQSALIQCKQSEGTEQKHHRTPSNTQKTPSQYPARTRRNTASTANTQHRKQGLAHKDTTERQAEANQNTTEYNLSRGAHAHGASDVRI
jgi:hypothetical protein